MTIRLFICLLIFPILLQSQTSDSLILENILIEATRLPSAAGTSTISIDEQELSRLHIGQNPAHTITELLPNVLNYSDSGSPVVNYSQFRLRGMDQSRMNISFNGIPMNDMLDHGVYFSNFTDFGRQLAGMQLTRGIGALSRSGIASYAGAIDFQSKNLFGERDLIGIDMTWGSFSTLQTSVEMAKASKDQGIYSRFSYTDSNGYKYNSGTTAYSGMVSAAWKTDQSIYRVNLLTGKTQNGQSYNAVPLSAINDDPRTNYNNHNDVDDFNQQLLHGQFLHHFKNQAHIKFDVYGNLADGYFPYTFDGVQYVYGLTNEHWGTKVDYTWQNKWGDWKVQSHAYHFKRKNYEYISPHRIDPYSEDFSRKREWNNSLTYSNYINDWHVYSALEWRRLSIDRNPLDSFTHPLFRDSYSFWNGIIGLRYEVYDGMSVWGSYGRVSREPTRIDLLNDVSAHESAHDWEFGIKCQPNNRLLLNTNVFWMKFNNEISKVGAIVERTYFDIRQNVPTSYRYGVEFDGSMDISEHWRIDLMTSWMKSNIDYYYIDGSPLTNVEQVMTPQWNISTYVHWSPVPKLSMTLNNRYVSKSYGDLSNSPEYVLPSFQVWNADIQWVIDPHIRIKLVVNNLFNSLYFTDGVPLDVDFDGNIDEMGYRVQPPRNALMSLSFDLQ